MLDFQLMAIALEALRYLYWILAICAFVFAIYKGKDRRSKTVGAVIVVAVFGFLPGKALLEQYQRDAYAKEAWAYFKKLCDEKSGEKIYKTFTGVKSVVVIKPLPPATDADHFDQFWFGDPYSAPATESRGRHAAGKLVYPNAPVSMGRHGAGFEFVEVYTGDPARGERVIKYFFAPDKKDYVHEDADKVTSRFAISWDDISTLEDRKFWIAASRLHVVDRTDNSIVAERIGYFIEPGFGSHEQGRRPWLAGKGPSTTCPYAHDWSDRWFLLKVFKPGGENNG